MLSLKTNFNCIKRTRGVVDEDQEGAWLGSMLKPTMVAAVDLDQLSNAFATKTGLMESLALLPRQPQTFSTHPAPLGLRAEMNAVALRKSLRSERWAKSR